MGSYWGWGEIGKDFGREERRKKLDITWEGGLIEVRLGLPWPFTLGQLHSSVYEPFLGSQEGRHK